MPTETLTKNGRVAPERAALLEPQKEDGLRARAVEQIQRVRRFKVHLVAFMLGVPVLGGVWVLAEYYEEHTWPSRFASAPDVAGTWDPWFFWVAGIWFVILAIHALKTYFGPYVRPYIRYSGPSVRRYIRRPPTTAEIDREIKRLTLRR